VLLTENKQHATLELLHGGELESTSRKYGVTAAPVAKWRHTLVSIGPEGFNVEHEDLAGEPFAYLTESFACGENLPHDHSPQFMSDDFQAEIAFLGIASSPAFVREPEGNGCIERFFRTLLSDKSVFENFPNLVLAEAS
jgi:hypothetical protein